MAPEAQALDLSSGQESVRSKEPQDLQVPVRHHRPQRHGAQGSKSIVGGHELPPGCDRTNTLEWVLVGSRNGGYSAKDADVWRRFNDANG